MFSVSRGLAGAALLATAVGPVGCSGADEPTFGVVHGGGDEDVTDVPACPVGTTAIDAAVVTLGESDASTVADYPGNIIPARDYTLGAYCVGTLPLPGGAGQSWPRDGLSLSQLGAAQALLAAGGRRLCTVPELMYAAAGPDNWRYPYDASSWDDSACESDDLNPAALGSYAACLSPLGVSDFQVRSTWARLDEVTRSSLEPFYLAGFDGDGVYAIWGGAARSDTFYAPSNFGIHFHGDEEDAYIDDGLRICADPGGVSSEQELEWTALVQRLLAADSFAGWLGDEGSTTGSTAGSTTGSTAGGPDTGDTEG